MNGVWTYQYAIAACLCSPDFQSDFAAPRQPELPRHYVLRLRLSNLRIAQRTLVGCVGLDLHFLRSTQFDSTVILRHGISCMGRDGWSLIQCWLYSFYSFYSSVVWRCGLVVDTWLRDQKLSGSSPGYARSTLSLGKALYMHFLTPCLKRVPDYRQYANVTRHL